MNGDEEGTGKISDLKLGEKINPGINGLRSVLARKGTHKFDSPFSISEN